jgi:manganese transport protein
MPPPSTIGSSTILAVPLQEGASAADCRGAAKTPAAFIQKLLAFSGPGYLVAVGYMDPGNWATGVAGGSAYGYGLLWVVVAANVMAMFLQHLAAKLGIASGQDLAVACRERYSPVTSTGLWLLCEAAIIACDLAEVLGAAIALKLLFHLPLVSGVLLSSLGVLLIMMLQGRGLRRIEAIIISLMAVIGLCFVAELFLSAAPMAAIARGLTPGPAILGDPAMLYLAIGILGATVMPHNLYLHSATVQSRAYPRTPSGRRQAVRFATFDLVIALSLAVFVNAAILILAATSFHARGLTSVASLEDAHRLLSPALGAGLAGVLFAVALLASGQNSAITGTLAGQIVMEGFTRFRLRPWARRTIARGLAIVPAICFIAAFGEASATRLLIFSQVILSLQLPFAVIPLVRLTSDRRLMGDLVNSPWVRRLAHGMCAVLVMLNAWMIMKVIF